jgi:hypothetical protein
MSLWILSVEEYVRLLDNVLINQQSCGGGSDLWNITPETTKVNNKCVVGELV